MGRIGRREVRSSRGSAHDHSAHLSNVLVFNMWVACAAARPASSGFSTRALPPSQLVIVQTASTSVAVGGRPLCRFSHSL